MATPVKIIPTLHGEAARAFIERAEERERNPHPTPIYTESEKEAYYRMLEESGMPVWQTTNAPDALAYYEKNGFAYLFPSEEVESISTRKDKAIVPQTTRLMYFDLKDSKE